MLFLEGRKQSWEQRVDVELEGRHTWLIGISWGMPAERRTLGSCTVHQHSLCCPKEEPHHVHIYRAVLLDLEPRPQFQGVFLPALVEEKIFGDMWQTTAVPLFPGIFWVSGWG